MWKTAINNTRAVFAVLRKELKEALSEDDIKNINETEMVVIMALKKLIPKKPVIDPVDYAEVCPNCKSTGIREDYGAPNDYCSDCGQAIEWGEYAWIKADLQLSLWMNT